MIDDTSVFTRFKGGDGLRLCREALADQTITRGNEAIVKALCKMHELQYHRAGDTIIKQGDGTNNLILILAGKVAVIRNNREIAHRAAGESVGEMAVIDVQQRRSASIVATEDCVVGSVPESGLCRYRQKISRSFGEVWPNKWLIGCANGWKASGPEIMFPASSSALRQNLKKSPWR